MEINLGFLWLHHLISLKEFCCLFGRDIQWIMKVNTVDGRNPAPPGMYKKPYK